MEVIRYKVIMNNDAGDVLALMTKWLVLYGKRNLIPCYLLRQPCSSYASQFFGRKFNAQAFVFMIFVCIIYINAILKISTWITPDKFGRTTISRYCQGKPKAIEQPIRNLTHETIYSYPYKAAFHNNNNNKILQQRKHKFLAFLFIWKSNRTFRNNIIYNIGMRLITSKQYQTPTHCGSVCPRLAYNVCSPSLFHCCNSDCNFGNG